MQLCATNQGQPQLSPVTLRRRERELRANLRSAREFLVMARRTRNRTAEFQAKQEIGSLLVDWGLVVQLLGREKRLKKCGAAQI